jgi:hypothetical protein
MKAVCRIEKQTKKPAIFFYDPDNGLSGFLASVTFELQGG